MAHQPLICTSVEAHGVGTKLVAVHLHDTPLQLEISPRFLLDELHRKPKGARMTQTCRVASHNPRSMSPTLRGHNGAEDPPSTSPCVWLQAAPCGLPPWDRSIARKNNVNSTLTGSGDQTARCPTTSPPPTVSDSWNRNERAAQPSWA